MSDASSDEREYVLGTGADELVRLGLQHRLWSDAAHAIWKRTGLQMGEAVLDIGCGPGYAAFDLAQLVTPAGRVVAVDESSRFISSLEAQARSRPLPQLTGRAGDVQSLVEAVGDEAPFDMAYARWVLCFVQDPKRVIAGASELLQCGGRLVIQDYLRYESMGAIPFRPAYAEVVAATAKSWREHSGDPDVIGVLPPILAEHGFELTHVGVHQRIARPHETMWAWPDTWWRTFTPKLVESGHVSRQTHEALLQELDELASDEHAFLILPPVWDIIATKR